MASITNILATVFTLLLFTFLTVTMYDKVDVELFRQYKSPIFIGAMFLFLAILGLPYMQYDVAHQAPVATFVSTAIGIVVILCALFVFALNWDVDQCVAAVSTLVIFTTILGRVSGPSDIPAFASLLLQFVLAGSVLFGTMKGAEWGLGRTTDPTIRLVLSYWIQIAPIGLWGMLVYGLYRGIRGLVDYRTVARPCPAPQAVPRFEPFQTQGPAPAPALPQLLQSAIDRTQDTLDALVEQTDATCAIMAEVEQGYIGARSGPEDEAEYKLPTEEQDRRKRSRQERAMKAFATSRKMFAGSRNTTPLECFQDVPEVSEYDLQVRELCAELHGLLENAETLTQIRNVQRMEADLAFAERQLDKAEGFQDATSVAAGPGPIPTPTPTQIYSVLEGTELEAAAKGLLAKELNLRNAVQQLQQKTKAVRARISKSYTKINMVATGDYNVTEDQLDQ